MKRTLIISFLVALGVVIAGAAFAQTIDSISPTSGARGQTVPVTALGSGLTGSCSVTVTGTGVVYTANSCNVENLSALSFTLVVDSTATPGSRTLTITGGGGLNQQFTFTVAPGEPSPGVIPRGPTTGAGFVALLETLTDWLFVGVLIGAVVFIVLAGLQFITGGGEPQQVSQARQKLLWAGIGILVALLSRGLVAAIRNIFGA